MAQQRHEFAEFIVPVLGNVHISVIVVADPFAQSPAAVLHALRHTFGYGKTRRIQRLVQVVAGGPSVSNRFASGVDVLRTDVFMCAPDHQSPVVGFGM